MFYRHPSADMLLTPDEIDKGTLRRAQALHFGSISLIGEPSRSATLHAIEVARGAGCLISCDPNLRLALWPDRAAARAGLLLAIEQAQLVKISDEELRFLTGSDDPSAARDQLWHDGLELMVVTLGSAGCVYFSRAGEGVVVGFGVVAVDATGAGDGFVAGLLQGIIADRGIAGAPARLRELCRFANAVGALTTTERGAIPALPTRDRVEALLERQGEA
jgi:fructokinase